jgi:phosphatidylserine/phosphatidylglycerophosphate/cardiolipin synthase-like enzyme
MLIDHNAVIIVPAVLTIAITIWSVFLYRRKSPPTLIFITGLIFLTTSICINYLPNTKFKISLFDNPQSITQVAFSPKQGATDLVLKTINGANKYIYVAAYTFTYKPIANALFDAHNRGIDVKIVLDNSQKNGPGNLLAYLKQSGIPTRIDSKYKIMHNKFMIVDGLTIQFGSFNYTKNAEEFNAENVVVISNDSVLISAYLNQWQKFWLESKELK